MLKRGILALCQQAGIVGDDPTQRIDPVAFALGEVGEDMTMHALLDAWMADADADAAVVVADMCGDRS